MSREKLIIRLLQRNDQRAIELLYNDYAAALYGVVFRIVLSEEIAQDVLQDAFVKIWKNGSMYDRSKGTLFTWVLNICRNKAIDATRSKHFRGNGKIQDWENFVHSSDKQFTEIPINHIGLLRHVDGLEEKYRKVIQLIYFQGYTQKEVTEELGIPLGTVKSRLKIGLRELKKLYQDVVTIFFFLFINL
ncbi:MAG: sigma-70 family RNA polymerase sigma factor [Bacteroidota bacterium]